MNLLWTYLELIALSYLSSIVDAAPPNDKKCPNLRLPGGKVRYQSKRKVAKFTCDDGATLVGQELAVCANGQWSVPVPTCVGNTCAIPQVDPLVSIESFQNGGLLQFFCSPGYIRIGPETISCSAGKWDAKPPTCQAGMSQGCDFEDGLCGWSDDLTDDFNWSRYNGKTPTADTGPNADHTKNDPTGHYIFVESSAPQATGHTARFLSPFYTTSALDGKCLRFYYHMFGEDGAGKVGDLDVYLRPDLLPTKSLGSDHQIFHKSGNQGDKWIEETLLIPKLTDHTQIVFQATIKNSWSSDIALDDILIDDCDKIDVNNKVTDDSIFSAQDTTRKTADDTVKTQRTTAPPRTTRTTKQTTKQTTRQTTRQTTKQTTRQTTKMTRSTTASTTKPTTSATPETTTSTRTTAPPTTTSRATTTTSTTTVPTTTSQATTTTPTTTSTSTTRTSPTTVTTPSTPTSTSTPAEDTTTMLSSTSFIDQTTDDVDTPAISTAEEIPEMSSVEISAQPADASTDVSDSIEETTPDALNATNTNDTSGEDYTNIDDERKRKVDEDSEDDDDDDESDNEGATNSTIGDNSEDEDSNNNDSEDSGNMDLNGNNAASGKVLAGDEGSTTKELLPLIIGVVSAVVVGAVVIGVLTWRWAKHQRMKQQKEEDDQMNIITEYVETTLN